MSYSWSTITHDSEMERKKMKPERKKLSFQHRRVGHTFWRCYNYLGSKLERKRCKDETSF